MLTTNRIVRRGARVVVSPALAGMAYGLFCLGDLFGAYAEGYPVHCRAAVLGPAGRDRLVQMGATRAGIRF